MGVGGSLSVRVRALRCALLPWMLHSWPLTHSHRLLSLWGPLHLLSFGLSLSAPGEGSPVNFLFFWMRTVYPQWHSCWQHWSHLLTVSGYRHANFTCVCVTFEGPAEAGLLFPFSLCCFFFPKPWANRLCVFSAVTARSPPCPVILPTFSSNPSRKILNFPCLGINFLTKPPVSHKTMTGCIWVGFCYLSEVIGRCLSHQCNDS